MTCQPVALNSNTSFTTFVHKIRSPTWLPRLFLWLWLCSLKQLYPKFNVAAVLRMTTCLMQTEHSVLRQVTLNEVVRGTTHLESLADSWIQHGPVHSAIHPHSADEEILLLHLLLTQRAPNRWYKDKWCLLVWIGEKTNSILTSLKTCKSATHTTTLTRWSSRCVERLRESVEWTSVEG